MGRIIDTGMARVFAPLEQRGRYIGAHGGRGSAKSHYFAEKLVRRCVAMRGTHAVCIREVQKSLAQSAKRTIEGKIQTLGVGHLFDVQKAEIKTPGGGLIIFQGMQNHTADSIKSLEGYDVAWVEEAQTLSQTSLRLLRPTLRKPGSELWFSWNPKKPDDPVDDFLRGNGPRKTDEPWEAPPATLVTLCADCHEPEHERARIAIFFLREFLGRFGVSTADDIGKLMMQSQFVDGSFDAATQAEMLRAALIGFRAAKTEALRNGGWYA